jgi:formyl-CoA transferase
MQDGVINLCRVKLRDQQRLAAGPLKEYSAVRRRHRVRRRDAARRQRFSGGGQPGRILKCKGWEDGSQRLHVFHHAGRRVGKYL